MRAKHWKVHCFILRKPPSQRIRADLRLSPVQDKFGNCKRKGTLGRIMAKLSHTSESVIHVGIIVLNLDKRLKASLLWLLRHTFLLCHLTRRPMGASLPVFIPSDRAHERRLAA